ncbi:hypothetical protein GGQ68_003557 [Sagittula marina]|uniref:Uncharacterized protein n=1 Tax=Sagittula marina TaxID=943940 RepID=A0A7W6GT81_9RHOB|nr:hypothetical protein [Sagittula marina]
MAKVAVLWGSAPSAASLYRLLALWDRFYAEDGQMVLLWLTRLNAWAPADEEAWEDLDSDARRLRHDGYERPVSRV